MAIEEARSLIVEKLKTKSLLVEVDEKYTHSKSFNSRGGGAIEPPIREQWFIDVNKRAIDWKGAKSSLREILIDVVRAGDISLVPDRFESTYFHWVENLRDWCISDKSGGATGFQLYRENELQIAMKTPEGVGWEQDPDTLDTWFSSALWTWSTLIDPDLAQDESISFEELLREVLISKNFIRLT